MSDDWDDEDSDTAFEERLLSSGPKQTLAIANDFSPSTDTTSRQRLVAAEQLRWQDPDAARSVLLRMVADVDLDHEVRLGALSAAFELGPPVQRAAVWLLDRIDYAYLSDSTDALYAAHRIVTEMQPGASWSEGLALVGLDVNFDDEVRVEAAAALVNSGLGHAAWLSVKEWFLLEDLPKLADGIRQHSSSDAWGLLSHIVGDVSVPIDIRVDAARHLVDDPDSAHEGLTFLLTLLRDDGMELGVRQRAYDLLVDDDCRDDLNAVVLKKHGLDGALDDRVTQAFLDLQRDQLIELSQSGDLWAQRQLHRPAVLDVAVQSP